ncbi:MAG: hypothetical protein GWP08_06870 [Nitrospiraceae bacterium]|nr:hypothetical protein [Nitrospiraceae bacterium]
MIATPGVATEEGALLIALPLVNGSDRDVSDVRISGITLETQGIVRPEALPLSAGDLPAGETAVLQLAFESEGLEADRPYTLRIEGTATSSGVPQAFRLDRAVSLPPPEEGERTVRYVTVETRSVDGGGFEPGCPGCADVDIEGINEFMGPPLPEGLEPASFEPNNPEVGIEHLADRVGKSQTQSLAKADQPITFLRAGTHDVRTGGVLEPSGGSVDLLPIPGRPLVRMVFLSGNLYLLLSTDGGTTYTEIAPTAVFPSIPLDGLPQDIGICCDQNLIYIPSIDRFVWQLLTRGSQVGVARDMNGQPILNEAGGQIPINGMNRLRVAMASPEQVISSGGTSWSYWDMTTATFGFPSTSFLDYPSLSFSDDYLYISVSALNPLKPQLGGDGFFVAAVPLTDVQNGGVIHIGHTDPKDGQNSYGARLAQDCPDAAYWFGHVSDRKLRVFEWFDGAGSYTWRTLAIDPWIRLEKEEDSESLTPDGTNWLRANIDAVRGGTCCGFTDQDAGAERVLLAAWNAGRGGGFPQPHVRLQRVVKWPTTWTTDPGTEIWNPDFAFHHAHLATNANGEVGISVAAGGGMGGDATPVAGFVGDSTLYSIGLSTASEDRWGDYTAIRPHWPNDALFSVSDYFLLTPKPPITGVHQYRLFGRTADIGDTS